MVGAVLAFCAALLVTIGVVAARHPATPPASDTKPYFQAKNDPRAALDSVTAVRTAASERTEGPLPCWVVGSQCLKRERWLPLDAQMAKFDLAVRSTQATEAQREDAWNAVASTTSGAAIGIDSQDRALDSLSKIYFVIAFFILSAALCSFLGRYGLALVALLLAFFPAGFVALVSLAPLAVVLVVAIPLGWIAVLYGQAAGGGVLPPFFANFEAEVFRLPAPARAKRLAGELTIGVALSALGVLVLAGCFLLAGEVGSRVAVIAPGPLAYGLMRALRAIVASRRATPIAA